MPQSCRIILFNLDLEIEGLTLPGIIAAGDLASEEIILGRTVLNHLALFVDGPKLQSAVLDERSASRVRAQSEL